MTSERAILLAQMAAMICSGAVGDVEANTDNVERRAGVKL